ncbi:MAG: caspase family protein [Myxococcota bacterium]
MLAGWFAVIGLSTVGIEGAFGARLVPQVGHLASVRQVALSADGTRLASAGRDGAVGIWHVASGAMLNRIEVPHEVLAVAFTENGSRVVAATAGGGWFTWDVASAEQLSEVTVDASWTSAQFVDEGTRLIAVDKGEGAALWRAKGRSGRTLQGVTRVTTQSATPDGRWVAAILGSEAGPSVGVFKGRSGSLVQSWEVGDSEGSVTVAISPDGKRVVTTDRTATATVWAARTGEPVSTLVLETEERRQIDAAFAPDGTVVTMDDRSTFRHWDGATVQQTVVTASFVDRGLLMDAAGLRVAAPEIDGGIGVWSLADGTRVAAMRGSVRAPRMLTTTSEFFAVGHDDGHATVWSPQTGGVRGVYEIGRTSVRSLQLHRSGLLVGTTSRMATLYNIRWGSRPLFELEKRGGSLRSAAIDMMGREVYVADPFEAQGWRINRYRSAPFIGDRIDWGRVKSSGESIGEVTSFKARPPTETPPPWLSLGDAGLVVVDEETGNVRASLYMFDDGNWAVVDPKGRFDTGDTALDGLRWVIDGQPYDLAQLRDRYYEPGLLAKLLGHNDEPLREVPPLASVEAPPVVHVVGPTPEGILELRIEDRGSGYGGVFATLNGSDVTSVVESGCPDLGNGEPCTLSLAELPTWMPGRENGLRVEVFSASGILRSRALDIEVTAQGDANEDAPDLWVLAVGTGDYRGDKLDLKYSPHDANRLAEALSVAGARGFGAARTHVRILSTSQGPDVHAPPSKAALEEGFAWLAQSDPLDTIVIYFSGHGVAFTDSDVDDYFYLLPDAGSFEDVRDPSVRPLRTMSGDELAVAVSRIPALKRVVILDTCAAGKIDAELSATRAALSSDVIRAHARSRERTGAWLLAGAAANKVSYEASRFGQGVLTYALIEGMLGPALDEADLLMVSRWLAWAESQVPKHAAGIGGVQEPVTRRGSAADFPLGQLPAQDRRAIKLRKVLPVMVSARVVGRGGRQDTLRCGDALNARLREVGGQSFANFVHWESDPIAKTWQITGTCSEARGGIVFEGFLSRTGEDGPSAEYPVNAKGNDVQAVAVEAVRAAAARVLIYKEE